MKMFWYMPMQLQHLNLRASREKKRSYALAARQILASNRRASPPEIRIVDTPILRLYMRQ